MSNSTILDSIVNRVEAAQFDRTSYVQKRLDSYRLRFNLWNRPDKKNDPDAFPWEGASDQRIFYIDGQIRKGKASMVMALYRSRMTFEPLNLASMQRAKLAEEFWDWYFKVRINPRREVNLAADMVGEKGLSILHVLWETETVEVEDALHTRSALPPEAFDPNGPIEETFLPQLRILFPDETDGNLVQALAQIRTGQEEVLLRKLVVRKQQPCFVACAPDTDIVLPPEASDIQSADWIVRIYRYSKAAFDRDTNLLKWNKGAAREISEKGFDANGKPRSFSNTSAEHATRSRQNGVSTLGGDGLEIYEFYEKVYDAQGNTSIRVVTYCPYVTNSPLRVLDNLGYAHGKYPFVALEAEVIGRNIHSSRGKPIILESVQEEMKIQTDSRIDRTVYSTVPMMVHPLGNVPEEVGPGASYGYINSKEEFGYAELRTVAPESWQVEMGLKASAEDYFGTMDPGASATGSITPRTAQEMKQRGAGFSLLQEYDLTNWLAGWQEAVSQAWALTQQYLSETIWFRAMGDPNSPPLRAGAEDIAGEYDFHPVFSMLDLAPQLAAESAMQILAATLNDRTGVLDSYEAYALWLNRLDVRAARRILRPQPVADKAQVDAELNALTRISAGIAAAIEPNTNHVLRLQIAMQYSAQPDIQSRLKVDEPFRKRLDLHLRQLQFAVQQGKNAQIGKFGAMPGDESASLAPKAEAPKMDDNAFSTAVSVPQGA